MILLPEQAVGGKKRPQLWTERCSRSLPAHSSSEKTQGLLELLGPLKPPLKPWSRRHTQTLDTQLTSQPTESPQVTKYGQKVWLLLHNKDGSSQTQLNETRRLHPGMVGTDVCAQSITSSLAQSQALEPSMRKDLDEAMQKGPQQPHLAISPLPGPPVSLKPCIYLPTMTSSL